MTWPEVLSNALPSFNAPVQPLALEADPRSVGMARRFVAEQTSELDEETAQDLRLVTSELVTNAVMHARTDLQVAVALTADAVVVMVHDLDLGRSELATHDRNGGRGLSIVQELARASGQVSHVGGGKTFWARLDRSGTAT